ncbi:MAG: SH3 domain-containing protein [Chloroflexi bacterium]|nr:SH3 domain-containing protein [Chloroflexota bacterium]
MRRLAYLLVMVGMLSLMLPLSVSAQQPLPASAWYAVVYQPESDTLHWITTQGQQAQINRPHLPNEVAYLHLRISPNGRSMVMVSQLVDGNQALGIYDFSLAAFVATHIAKLGETINLGSENIFTANSQFVAVGFSLSDFANSAWRVILFEVQTGAAITSIDSVYPNAPGPRDSVPNVQYIDDLYVHFQLIPQAVGAWHTWPAYAWRVFGFDPAAPVLTESPYTRADFSIQLLTGQSVMTYADPNFAAMPPSGQLLNFNAIGTAALANGNTITPIYTDATRYLMTVKWAKGGEWILFLTIDDQMNRAWNIALSAGTPGNNSYIPFDPQFVNVYGTSDGYLLVNAANGLYYSNGFNPTTAQQIGQLTPNGKVVYVTPIGVESTLAQLPVSNGGEVQITPPPVIITPPPVVVTVPPPATDDCSAALPQRVSIGSIARVVTSMGALNLRQTPNGTILTTLAGGDIFNVIGGPICADNLYWWQVDRSGMIGWLAEGSNSYYIELYDGTPPPPPPLVAPTGCEQALPPRLTVGGTATIVDDQQRPHNGPAGEIIPQRFYRSGTVVTVNAGPECAGGQYWWLVTGQAQIGRVGQNYISVQGWVSEAEPGSYNLAP